MLKVICAFFLLWHLNSCGNREVAAKVKSPVAITSIIVEAKDIPATFEYVAQTQSSHKVNIQARVSGFLESRVYTEGQIVMKGQELFIMDKKPFQTQVDAAKAVVARQVAALETARLNLQRVQPLAKLNALSQKDLDDANGSFLTNSAAVEQAKAQLETALLNLSYCTILSPLDGITSAAQQQDGTYLNVQDSLLTTVSALSPIWVNFSLSENQVLDYRDQVAKGQLVVPNGEEFEVKVILINGALFPHTGHITFTEPFFNPQTGTFLIRASVNNPDGILRPNQYVRAQVTGAIRPNAILIPQRAVQQSAKGHYVWVVDKQRQVEFRPINVGEWEEGSWLVTEGLRSGDEVVVDGGMTLYAGAEVTLKSVN